MVKSSFCYNSDVYILVKGTAITSTATDAAARHADERKK